MAVKSTTFSIHKINTLINSMHLFRYAVLLLILFHSSQCFSQEEVLANPFPEQSEINELISGEEPEGLVFLVMEHDEEALYWVLPRVSHYTQQLHEKWHDLPIVVLSHGDEMLSLVDELVSLNEKLHQSIKDLAKNHDVVFQVCGSYAFFSDIDASEFPAHIDVVPSAPAEISNYRQMEYKFISLDLIW